MRTSSDSDDGEEESDESEEDSEDVELSSDERDFGEDNNVMELEALVNYELTLNVEGTVNLRINKMGEGMTEIKTREHPDEIAKKDITLTTCLLGYNHSLKLWAEKEKIAEAARKLVSHDITAVTRRAHRSKIAI